MLRQNEGNEPVRTYRGNLQYLSSARSNHQNHEKAMNSEPTKQSNEF